VHSFLRSRNGVFTLFDLPGVSQTFALGINPGDETTGFYIDQHGVMQGFVRAH